MASRTCQATELRNMSTSPCLSARLYLCLVHLSVSLFFKREFIVMGQSERSSQRVLLRLWVASSPREMPPVGGRICLASFGDHLGLVVWEEEARWELSPRGSGNEWYREGLPSCVAQRTQSALRLSDSGPSARARVAVWSTLGG